jgi:hypothetical protein
MAGRVQDCRRERTEFEPSVVMQGEVDVPVPEAGVGVGLE